ncbi:MAG: bifunctional UDP-N-acetylglucosamine diphosphorylase/glucosamine-1-phosphate N-acetyltransferase GlmU [Deltaproteobacteria bacterium]|nr:bifunctional UDP-N-acetylglucosamine diphosphorylase/glucosamine-1-phosphate N-acetyltransferase GlmU [Deltaproteobacteria bacterium]
MKNIAAIVLAAGKGRRMKSSIPKVLHRVAGRPMLSYPLMVLRELGIRNITVVAGHKGDSVKALFSTERSIAFAGQKDQKGTGHAVMCALKTLKGFHGDILILSGDVPLITGAAIKGLIKVKKGGKENARLAARPRAAISFITAVLDDPDGYGRVVRDENNTVERVVEDKDCTEAERRISEVNTGIYLISSEFLFDNIKKLKRANVQGEYYLPDLIGLAKRTGHKVAALTHLYPDEVMGVNNRVELARAGGLMRQRIAEALMLAGVTIVDPDSTYIDSGVKAGMDTVICPFTVIEGATSIGVNCVIEEGVKIRDSVIGDETRIKSYSVIEDSSIGKGAAIGPFARLRPGNRVADGASVGNFVEMKKTSMGRGSKANHLSYLGDAEIGANVNIGAGAITCNYDGMKKHTTIIEDGAFIGSDSQLVAPVKVGRNAYVGSGTTVTRDVPAGALMTARAKERVVEGWVGKRGIKKAGGRHK